MQSNRSSQDKRLRQRRWCAVDYMKMKRIASRAAVCVIKITFSGNGEPIPSVMVSRDIIDGEFLRCSALNSNPVGAVPLQRVFSELPPELIRRSKGIISGEACNKCIFASKTSFVVRKDIDLRVTESNFDIVQGEVVTIRSHRGIEDRQSYILDIFRHPERRSNQVPVRGDVHSGIRNVQILP